MLTAICEAAEITSLAGGQGRMRHQARFWLRSLNLPQVPVVLPDGADLWSVMLDGNPVEVRRKQGAYIVPLPAGDGPRDGATRELTLLYETGEPAPGRRRSRGGWGRLWPQTVRQTAPKIALTTLGATWRVQPPEGTDLVASGGDFQPETPLGPPHVGGRPGRTIASRERLGTAVESRRTGGGRRLCRPFRAGQDRQSSRRLVEMLVVVAIGCRAHCLVAAGHARVRVKRPAAWRATTTSSRSAWPCTTTTRLMGSSRPP